MIRNGTKRYTQQHSRLKGKKIMSYSAESCQGAIFVIVVCVLMLSAVMRRRNQQINKKKIAKTKKIPQEHDERFF